MAGQDGQWGTLSYELPDFLAESRDAINSVAEILIAALDIALVALKLGKAYLVAFLDPVLALAQALVDELEGIIKDLQQLGLYMTGDWKLLSWPFDDLKGGYAEYERRMISRLTDRTDPTRPDIAATMSVLAIFFYLSVDISEIQRLIRFILQLIKFFNQSYLPGGQPPPVITSIKYGSETASILQPMSIPDYFKKGKTPPQVAQVKWTVKAPAQGNPFNPFPAMPPKGFIVTVSTVKEGIQVRYDRPQANAGKAPATNGGQSQPREYGLIREYGSGRPLVLHGGAQLIDLPYMLHYNNAIDGSGKLRDGYARVYGTLPNGSIIPLEDLGISNPPLLQRSFFVPIGYTATQWLAGSEYMITLNAEDMPQDAVYTTGATGTRDLQSSIPTSTFYVRVATCTQDIGEGKTPFKYDFTSMGPLMKSAGLVPSAPLTVGEVSDISVFSDAQVLTFPNIFTQQYLEAVQVALVVLVLSRPDLVPLDELAGILSKEQKEAIASKSLVLNHVALERCRLERVQGLTGFIYSNYPQKIEERGAPLRAFRSDLLKKVELLTNAIYAKTGPMPQAEEAIVKQTEYLRTVTWGDIFKEAHPEMVSQLGSAASQTILQSVQSNIFSTGLALNPYSMGLSEDSANALFYIDGLVQDRLPQMMEVSVGSEDPSFTPVLQVPKAKVPDFMASLSPSLLHIYEKYVQKDGSIVVAGDATETITQLAKPLRKEGSADVSPVFFINRSGLSGHTVGDTVDLTTMGVYYARGLFAKVKDGEILRQSAVALSVAGAAMMRSPADGEWLTLRFFDQFPSWAEFFQQLTNWVKAIVASVQSVVDTILKYIEFVEARIADIQQLIQRINALLQAMLGFAFKIPKCSALFLVANGTSGLLSGLVSSENKPNDTPLAYGAGVAVVIPFGPVWVMDLIRLLFASEEGSPGEGDRMGVGALPFPAAVGIEELPAPIPIPDEPPDVL